MEVSGRSPARGARRGRISRSAEFERVYRQGRSYGNRYFVLHAFARGDGAELREGPRLGLSVSRKVGGAVERNTVKRLVREAFPRVSRRLPAGFDIVVVARTESQELASRDGLEGVVASLEELVAKASAGQTS